MLLKLAHKCYSKLLKVFTNVIQIDAQALINPQMLLRLTTYYYYYYYYYIIIMIFIIIFTNVAQRYLN